MEAARTADAWPSTTAATKSGGPAAPPDATRGTGTRSAMARSSAVSKPCLGAVAVDRGDEQLAGAELHDLLRPGDGIEARGLASALDDDLPGGRLPGVPGRRRAAPRVDGDDDRLRPEAAGAAPDEVGGGDGGRVERDLVGPGPQDVAHLGGGPDPAPHRQGHEGAARRPLDDVAQRRPALGRRRDVEEDDLVRALGSVAPGELCGVARVDEVHEPGSLDDPPAGDVEAGDDPHGQHRSALTRRPAPRGTRSWRGRRARHGRCARDGTGDPARLPDATALTNSLPCSVSARATSADAGPVGTGA